MLYDSFRNNEKINKILNSEQFQYSEKIMEIRINLNLNIYQIAKLLNLLYITSLLILLPLLGSFPMP